MNICIDIWKSTQVITNVWKVDIFCKKYIARKLEECKRKAVIPAPKRNWLQVVKDKLKIAFHFPPERFCQPFPVEAIKAVTAITPSFVFINGPISPGNHDMSHQSANDSTLLESLRSNNWKSHSAINHLYCSQIAVLRDYSYSKSCDNLNKLRRRSNYSLFCSIWLQ